MSWKIRHQGSPRSIEGLTPAQVVEGLQDGLWEPTDEVMDAEETQWTAIENHPQFAEIAADLEPPPPPAHPDETHLDMNPLIDVALVLLIFFMLVATYDKLRQVLDMPSTTTDEPGRLRILAKEDRDRMVKVNVAKRGDAEMITVEDQPVDLKDLTGVLRRFRRSQLVLIAEPDVTWGTTIAIHDAAKGAHIEKIYRVKK